MRLNFITSRDKPGLRQLLLHVQDIGFLIMHSVMFSAFILKVIFRDSVGSGKYGKCLKNPYVEKPWII